MGCILSRIGNSINDLANSFIPSCHSDNCSGRKSKATADTAYLAILFFASRGIMCRKHDDLVTVALCNFMFRFNFEVPT